MPHLTLYGRDYVAKKRATTEAAFSDLKMIQTIAKTMTRRADIPDRKGPISLNADSRKTEIFRIMKENHRLLDRLETLEPVVSTSDLIRDHKSKQRYTILVSHSKRLAGEYDDEVSRIANEDKAKSDAMNASVERRRSKYRDMQESASGRFASGSMRSSSSMPSLTPLASTDPGPSVASASPSQQRGRPKPTVVKRAGMPSSQSSSSSTSLPRAAPPAPPPEAPSPPAPAARIVVAEETMKEPSNMKAVKKSASRVSFSAEDEKKQDGSRSSLTRVVTPHARDGALLLEESPKMAPAQDESKASDEAPAPEASKFPVTAEDLVAETPAREAVASLSWEDLAAEVSKLSVDEFAARLQELSQDARDKLLKALADDLAEVPEPLPAESPVAETPAPQADGNVVGLAEENSRTEDSVKKEEEYEEDYEEDFAEESQTQMSQSRAVTDSATLDEDPFESSKDG
jgi:hypothetical protein